MTDCCRVQIARTLESAVKEESEEVTQAVRYDEAPLSRMALRMGCITDDDAPCRHWGRCFPWDMQLRKHSGRCWPWRDVLACRRRGRARQLKAQAAVQAPDSLHPSTFLGGWKILQRYQRVTKTALKLTLFEVDQVGEKIQKSLRKSTKMDVLWLDSVNPIDIGKTSGLIQLIHGCGGEAASTQKCTGTNWINSRKIGKWTVNRLEPMWSHEAIPVSLRLWHRPCGSSWCDKGCAKTGYADFRLSANRVHLVTLCLARTSFCEWKSFRSKMRQDFQKGIRSAQEKLVRPFIQA